MPGSNLTLHSGFQNSSFASQSQSHAEKSVRLGMGGVKVILAQQSCLEKRGSYRSQRHRNYAVLYLIIYKGDLLA